MVVKTFEHQIPSGENVKFSIFEKFIDGKKYHYAMLINVDIDSYKNLKQHEKETFYGIEMKQGTGKVIHIADINKLEKEIKEKYGTDNLIQSEAQD